MSPSPAQNTKHLPILDYEFSSNFHFQLAQSDSGLSNGTALWLGAQCLSAYLAHFVKPGCSVIELGSGIGLTSLVLAALGWKQVVATDTALVINTVLAQNITNNLPHLPLESNTIFIRELDWTVGSDKWIWDHPNVIASTNTPTVGTSNTNLIANHFDLIITADTVYEPSLISPLLRTIHTLCITSGRSPPVLLCLERRDPSLVDRTLAEAREQWNFAVDRIPDRKVSKAMEKSGIKWDRDEWEGVEIWKLTLKK
ncbi:hypothetical protein VNI00_008204 [Paramarasmius palmivorus]|uniref:Uncharacterized protein n=1 Tax=Paramarasmius palmivorus TaxID=297713 RepID=A0AAW0CWW6_9AGAR